MLLVGSGLLAVSLLVLSLTKWGQARPVWKCVVLSVAAHILLMGYAYGTHLIFQVPQVAQPNQPVRINLVEDEGNALNNELQDVKGKQPWGEFVNKQLLPDIDDLERPAIDSQLVIEPTDNTPKPPQKDIYRVADLEDKPLPTKRDVTVELSDKAFEIDQSVAAKEIEASEEIVEQSATEKPMLDPAREKTELVEIDREFESSESQIEDKSVTPEPTPFTSELTDVDALIASAKKEVPQPAKMPTYSKIDRVPTRTDSPMKVVKHENRAGDGQPMPEIYKLRSNENRLAAVERRGGSIETEKAVQAALVWLAANQQQNGGWNPRSTGAGTERKVFGHDRDGAGSQSDSGITALAVLAFMASGNTHLEGQYQENVQKGLEFLIRNQATNGSLAGSAKLYARMYCHSISLLALSEALALTGDSRLTAHVQRGVDYSVYAQNKTDGGWRYQPGDQGDMSQFGWQVLAMHSAKAGGIYVPPLVTQKMNSFLESCCSGVGNGLASYRPKQRVSTTMTAEALVCRFFLQEDVAHNTKTQASNRVLREVPSEHHVNLYYWYYGTMAMYHTGGKEWERWNQPLKNALLKTQVSRGKYSGSWEPTGLWAGYGGRVYSTAMAALCLEVYYRYLPMYEVAAAKKLQTDNVADVAHRPEDGIIRLR